MAHFAELDGSNIVLRVIVIDNDEVIANGGDESTQAEEYVKNLVGLSENGVVWKQTSYNNNFRKQYASIGSTYDSGKDMFILPKPYTSWTNDSSGDWNAPVTYPNDLEENSLTVFTSWDEDNQKWLGSTWSDNSIGVGTETKYEWEASGLSWTAL